MRERRQRLGFTSKSGLNAGVGRDVIGQDLDRNLPFEARVVRHIDLTHPPSPDGGADGVRAK